MYTERIDIPAFDLKWTEWFSWDDLKLDARSNPNAIDVPNESGVYEVKVDGKSNLLHIGRASNLRRRVKQGLVKGKNKHSSGKRIRAHEDVTQLRVRWAIADRPAATEEELHMRYRAQHDGDLPKYTKQT